MDVEQFIQQVPAERQELLANIHRIIMANDPSVEVAVEPMMGKEMLIYKARGYMKYGLSSVKQYMSLHVLPIYGSAKLHGKYSALLPGAAFQKGCINFKNAGEMPLEIVAQLMQDCAPIDLLKTREEYLASRPKKSSKKTGN
ncbi:MAG: hypothetical protein H6577_14680 [Lewinellaceae bacterium]|nr:hypothetical protein [Saprospiraceae bacterium]MCB9339373.1 hypothetical protein [Lewinellaceae bacterium]